MAVACQHIVRAPQQVFPAKTHAGLWQQGVEQLYLRLDCCKPWHWCCCSDMGNVGSSARIKRRLALPICICTRALTGAASSSPRASSLPHASCPPDALPRATGGGASSAMNTPNCMSGFASKNSARRAAGSLRVQHSTAQHDMRNFIRNRCQRNKSSVRAAGMSDATCLNMKDT